MEAQTLFCFKRVFWSRKRRRHTLDGITLLSHWELMAFLSWKRSLPFPFKWARTSLPRARLRGKKSFAKQQILYVGRTQAEVLISTFVNMSWCQLKVSTWHHLHVLFCLLLPFTDLYLLSHFIYLRPVFLTYKYWSLAFFFSNDTIFYSSHQAFYLK